MDIPAPPPGFRPVEPPAIAPAPRIPPPPPGFRLIEPTPAAPVPAPPPGFRFLRQGEMPSTGKQVPPPPPPSVVFNKNENVTGDFSGTPTPGYNERYTPPREKAGLPGQISEDRPLFGEGALKQKQMRPPIAPHPGMTTIGKPSDMVDPGNINLTDRPIVHNPDGSYSTIRSMSFGEEQPIGVPGPDGKPAMRKVEVLVPTVSEDGRIMSDQEAWTQYQRTGKHLGKFATIEAADEYAKTLHEEGAKYVEVPPTKGGWDPPADASPLEKLDFINRRTQKAVGEAIREGFSAPTVLTPAPVPGEGTGFLDIINRYPDLGLGGFGKTLAAAADGAMRAWDAGVVGSGEAIGHIAAIVEGRKDIDSRAKNEVINFLNYWMMRGDAAHPGEVPPSYEEWLKTYPKGEVSHEEFLKNLKERSPGLAQGPAKPAPSPHWMREGEQGARKPGSETVNVLRQAGFSDAEIAAMSDTDMAINAANWTRKQGGGFKGGPKPGEPPPEQEPPPAGPQAPPGAGPRPGGAPGGAAAEPPPAAPLASIRGVPKAPEPPVEGGALPPVVARETFPAAPATPQPDTAAIVRALAQARIGAPAAAPAPTAGVTTPNAAIARPPAAPTAAVPPQVPVVPPQVPTPSVPLTPVERSVNTYLRASGRTDLQNIPGLVSSAAKIAETSGVDINEAVDRAVAALDRAGIPGTPSVNAQQFRNDETISGRAPSVAVNAQPLPQSEASSLEELRRTGNRSLPRVAERFPEVSGGPGTAPISEAQPGQIPGQQRELPTGERALGNAVTASKEQAADARREISDLRRQITELNSLGSRNGVAPIGAISALKARLADRKGALKTYTTEKPSFQPVKERRASDILSFIKSQGGIRPHGDLAALDIPPYHLRGGLVRRSGLPLDMMREAAAEAGYFGGDRGAAVAETTPSDLTDLIDRALRGEKIYPVGEDESRPVSLAKQEELARHDVEQALVSGGVEDAQLADRATNILLRRGGDPVDAIEAAAIELEDETLTPEEIQGTDNGIRKNVAGSRFQAIANGPEQPAPVQRVKAGGNAGAVPGETPPAAPGEGKAPGRPSAAEAVRGEPASPTGQGRQTQPAAVPEGAVNAGSERNTGRAEAGQPKVEPGAEGKPQTVLPGAERVTQKEARAAQKKLRAAAEAKVKAQQSKMRKAGQKPADEQKGGLFEEKTKPLFSQNPERSAQIANNIRSIIARVAGDRFKVELPSTINIADFGGQPKEVATAAAAAGFSLNKTAGGMFRSGVLPGDSIISVALYDPKYSPESTAYHESWHAVERWLLRANEKRLIAADLARGDKSVLRRLAAERFRLEKGHPFIRHLPDREVTANGFQGYSAARAAGEANPGKGLIAGIRRAFDRLIKIFKAVRGMISSKYPDVEKIFSDAYEGKFAGNEPQGFETATYTAKSEAPEFALGFRRRRGATIEPNRSAAFKAVAGRIGGRTRKGLFSLKHLKGLYSKIQDDLHELGVAERAMLTPDGPDWQPTQAKGAPSIYEQLRLTRGSMGIAEHWIQHGTVDILSGEINGPSLEDFIQETNKRKNNDVLDAYLAAKRAQELEARGVAHGFDMGEINQFLADQGAYITQTLEPIRQGIDMYNDKRLEMLRDSGILNQEKIDAIKALNKFYVPFQRMFDDARTTGVGAGGGLKVKNPIFRIHGSDKNILSPLESIVRNTITDTALAYRNRALVKLTKLSEASPHGDQFFKRSRAVHPIGVTEQEIERWLKDHGMLRGDPNAMSPIDRLKKLNIGEMMTIYRPQPFFHSDSQIVTYENGKRIVWDTTPEIAAAVNGLHDVHLGWVHQLLGSFARVLRAGVTLDFGFPARNFIRDQFDARAYVGEGRFVPFVSSFRELGQVLGKGELYREWQRHGGAQAAMVSVDRRYLEKYFFSLKKKTLGGKVVHVPAVALEGMRKWSELTENATRLAVYRSLRKKGHSPSKAAYMAREATQDFQRQGSGTKKWNQIDAFFTASLSGPDRMARAFKMRPLTTALMALITITVPSLILWSQNHKDPRWQKMDKSQRDSAWWYFPTSDPLAAGIPIPKPWLLGFLFGSVPERLLSAFVDHDPHAFDSIMLSAYDVTSFSVYPTILVPWVHYLTNQKWTGAPLIPEAQKGIQPPYQQTSGTTATAKEISNLMTNIPLVGGKLSASTLSSPIVIDEFLNSYTGTMGRNISRLVGLGLVKAGLQPESATFPATWQDVPGIGRFYGYPLNSTAEPVQQFYDHWNDELMRTNTFNMLIKQGRIEEANRVGGPGLTSGLTGASGPLGRIEQDMAADVKQIRIIQGLPKSSMSDNDKITRIREIYQTMIGRAEIGNQLWESVDRSRRAQ